MISTSGRMRLLDSLKLELCKDEKKIALQRLKTSLKTVRKFS